MLPTPRVEVGARRDRLRVGGSLRYSYATGSDVLGSVHAHVVAPGVAASYAIVSAGRVRLVTGPRFEIGAFFGHGSGDNESSTTRAALSAAWELELHVDLGTNDLLVTAEGGSFLRGVVLRADARDVLDLSVPFAGFSVGITR
ncbi:MAG: hypothetical protein JST00_34725 [Deltaproteobacteria bacterium]|nr:hypothetical protein [Deltaproteobacteria bacterium]